MSTVILSSHHGDGELRIDRHDHGATWDVGLDVGGLHGRTRVDAAGAGSQGWHHEASVLVSGPAQGLAGLCEYLGGHVDGWFAEEVWRSADGRLALGFSHHDDHVRVAVTVAHEGQAAWTASARIDVAVRDLGALVGRLRELIETAAVAAS